MTRERITSLNPHFYTTSSAPFEGTVTAIDGVDTNFLAKLTRDVDRDSATVDLIFLGLPSPALVKARPLRLVLDAEVTYFSNFRSASDTSSTGCPRAPASSAPTTCSARFTVASSVCREGIGRCRDGTRSNDCCMIFVFVLVLVTLILQQVDRSSHAPSNIIQDIFEFSAAFPRKSAFDMTWEEYADRTVAWCDRLVADTAPLR